MEGIRGVSIRGRKSPKSSERMRNNNPMKSPDAVEAMRKKLVGRTFLSRGGNSKITEPQKILADAIGLPMEYAINTAPVRHLFESVPNSYKVDLAVVDLKIAIEVDGNSHKTKKWKFLDKRKTEILNALGWSVLRFWNKDVMENMTEVLATIQQSMTLRLKEITTSSRPEY